MIKRKTYPKRIKIILLIILTLILFIGDNSVKAAENDSVLVRNKNEDIYAIAPLSDRTHLYYLEMYTINNIPTYCIELGKSILSTTYNSTDNIEEQKRITNLTEEQLNYINLVAYFGYLYEENGILKHTEREYYMAAQEIIWEYLNNIDITWTNEPSINGNLINLDEYKREINRLIIRYDANVDIPNSINLKVGDNKKYVSTNLFLYKLIDNKGIGNINGDYFNISIPSDFIGNEILNLIINTYTNNKMKIYYKDNSQILLSKGKIKEKQKEIKINVEGKTLNTYLVDKETGTNLPQGQASLENAEYELYDKDNNLITTFTTDETLKNTINNLYNEKYYIKQTKASEGYKINNQVVEVDLSKTDSIILEEEIIKSDVEIIKMYEVNNKLEREENIEFSFHYYDKTTDYYGNIITTKNGKDIITLPYGKYRITQENTIYGYEKVETIYLNINEESNSTITLNLVNNQIKTKLNIITKDKETNQIIKDNTTTYKIKDQDGNYLTYASINGTIDSYKSNENGELLLPFSIPYGKYHIEQVKAPNNYLKNKEIIEVIIDENTNYINDNKELLVQIDYYNKKIKGKINIITNKDNESVISIRPNIEIDIYKDNNIIQTVKTDKKGIASIDNLELGTYCLIEKHSKNKECVELVSSNDEDEIVEKEVILTEIIKNKMILVPNTLSNKKRLNYKTILLLITIGVIIYKKSINIINTIINNNTTTKRR